MFSKLPEEVWEGSERGGSIKENDGNDARGIDREGPASVGSPGFVRACVRVRVQRSPIVGPDVRHQQNSTRRRSEGEGGPGGGELTDQVTAPSH